MLIEDAPLNAGEHLTESDVAAAARIGQLLQDKLARTLCHVIFCSQSRCQEQNRLRNRVNNRTPTCGCFSVRLGCS